MEKKISGAPDLVLKETLRFLTEAIPYLQLISRITLTVDAEAFLSSCENVFASTPEGVVILAQTEKLADRD
ncbi:MAG: hypothetical protein QXF26_06905, partial [Candidatus Bathyarchaeia archaeon]